MMSRWIHLHCINYLAFKSFDFEYYSRNVLWHILRMSIIRSKLRLNTKKGPFISF